MSPAESVALRALRDCKVVRARSYAPGFHELHLRGLAWRGERVRDRGGDHAPRFDYRLTVAGEIAARHQLEGSHHGR